MPNEREAEVLQRFKYSNWMDLNEDQRTEACQELENCLAVGSRRMPCKIETGSGSDQLQDNTTFIDITDNPYETLESVVREAFQTDKIELIHKKNYVQSGRMSADDYINELEQKGVTERDILVMIWENNNYLTADDSHSLIGNDNLHKMQFTDIYAKLESTKYLGANREIIGNEEGFNRFLGSKEHELKELQELFRKEDTVKQWFDDRRNRLNSSDVTSIGILEQIRIRNVFIAKDINKIDSLVLKNLQSIGSVTSVTLDSLLGKNEGKDVQSSKRTGEPSPPKAKKAKLGLG